MPDRSGGGAGEDARVVSAEEVADELRFHLEGRTRELMGEGWPEAAARAEAARLFGDKAAIEARCVALTRERIHRERRVQRMSNLWWDVRTAARTLRRSGGFAFIVMLTLGLGIGATTAIFTVVDGVLIRPLPFESPDRLVQVWETHAGQGIARDRPSPPNYTDWKQSSRSFELLSAWTEVSLTATSVTEPVVLSGVAATANFFDVFGAQALLGRTFAAGEGVAGSGLVAVLGHAVWRDMFGSDPSVLGHSLELNGVPVEVIGVMPADFRVPQSGVDLWLATDYGQATNRQTRYLEVVGRLRDGVTIDQASAELNAIATRLDESYPASNDGWRVALVPAHEQVVGDARGILLLLLAAVGFVLALACVNVANLVLGRAISRGPELAIRAALGASVGRLRSQRIVENVVLGLIGGALGVALAYLGVRTFLALEPEAVPRAEEIGIDLRVLVFAVVMSIATGVMFGLIPGARVGRPGAAVRQGREVGGRRADAVRRSLVVIEVALSLVILVGAGLALRGLRALHAVDPGYDKEGILAGRIDLDAVRYPANPDRIRYFERLVAHLAEVPGVEAVGVTSTLPLTHGIDFNLPYRAEGHPDVAEGQLPQADYRVISPGYIEAMGIAVVAGRAFAPADRAGSRRVMLVNETFARTHWPSENAVGKRVRIHYVTNDEFEVVGVAGDTRHVGLATPSSAQMFVPLGQADVAFSFMTVVVRPAAGGPSVLPAIRAATLELDRNEPLYMFQTIEGLVSEVTARERLVALVFSVFALLAIVLSAAGIYGVISYQVARRTREIGVRMALGAARSRVVSRVVGEAAALAALGIVIGVGIAAAATRLASARLFGIRPLDPFTFASVSGLLLAVAILAALLPAWRAATIQPVRALRPD